MEIHFTIGWAWVEAACHIMAAFMYIASGFDMARGDGDFGLFTLLAAIGLTTIGAGL